MGIAFNEFKKGGEHVDITRFYKALDYLVDDEENYEIQESIESISSALKALASNPAEQSYQVALSRNLDVLRKAVVDMMGTYNPAQFEPITEIGALPYYSLEVIDNIEREIINNPMTPATARDFISKFVTDREMFLIRVRYTHAYFKEFGIDLDEPMSGKAEIGFEILAKYSKIG